MTLSARVLAFIALVGPDVKVLFERSQPAGGTTGQVLTKTANTNYASSWQTPASGGASINDTTPSTGSVYSSTKTDSQIADARASLKTEIFGGGVSAALDTLTEIEARFGTDATASANLLTAVGFRVRYDAAQSLDSTQKAQAKANIDAYGSVEIGNPDTDFAAAYVTAKA